MDFVLGIIRGFFGMLDKIVIWAMNTLYTLMLEIADVNIFGNSNELVMELSSRITILLGVFMVFKLTFSFLGYVVNPEQLTDKSKGFSKIIQNVIISLVLLTSYQFLFNKIMAFQGVILKDNTIARIILGAKNSSINVSENARTLSFTLFSAFITPNSNMTVCDNYLYLYNKTTMSSLTGDKLIEATNLKKECDSSLATYSEVDLATDHPRAKSQTLASQLEYAVTYSDTDTLFDYVIKPKGTNGIFAFNYQMIVSGACGIFACLILLSFCFDIAIRAIKLGFLNLIAPIPIISYIDPVKGEGIFKKWLSNLGKTYADLFVRLVAIYFAVYIIQVVVDTYSSALGTGFSTYSGSTLTLGPIVLVFIILGALMFAKQFPKLIQDITGINLGDGKFKLNPLKRIENDAIGGKAIHSAVRGARGLVTGAAFGTVGAFTGAGAMRGVFGAFSGLSAGLHGKKFGEIRKQQVDANARMRTAILDGSTFGGRTHERFSAFMGTGGRMTTITSQKHQINDRIKTIDVEIEAHEAENKIRQQSISSTNGKISDLTEAANSIKALEDRAKEKIQNGESAIGIAYLQRKNAVDVLKAKTITADAKSQAMLDKLIQQREATADATKRGRIQNLINYQEKIIKTDIATREKQLADEIAATEAEANKYLNEQGMYEYMSGVINGTIGDASFSNMYETAVQKNNFAHIDISTMNGEQLHSSMGQTKGNIGDAQRGIAEIERDIKATEEQIKNKQSIKAKESEILHRIEKEQENPIKVNQDAIKH